MPLFDLDFWNNGVEVEGLIILESIKVKNK
jgi:hypothetical protein